MEEINWNIASNAQLQEECERLQNLFNEKREQMANLHNEMVELSKEYVEIKTILNTRQGKKDGSTK